MAVFRKKGKVQRYVSGPDAMKVREKAQKRREDQRRRAQRLEAERRSEEDLQRSLSEDEQFLPHVMF